MVEIIPKPTAKYPPLIDLLFYFSLFLAFLSISSFLILSLWQKKQVAFQNELKRAISQEQKSLQSWEDYVLPYQKKLDDFSLMLSLRRDPLKFFSVLEKLTHPQIQFTQLKLNLETAEAGLTGLSQNFLSLYQQILILENSAEIKEVQLSNVSLAKEAGASFSLTLKLDEKIFK